MATTTLSFSYDATKADYHNNPFRLGVIKFLVENRVFSIRSYVATTIYFKTEVQNPLQTWKKLIVDNFDDDFTFTLSIVPLYQDESDTKLAYAGKFNNEYCINFNDDVIKVQQDKLAELKIITEKMKKELGL